MAKFLDYLADRPKFRLGIALLTGAVLFLTFRLHGPAFWYVTVGNYVLLGVNLAAAARAGRRLRGKIRQTDVEIVTMARHLLLAAGATHRKGSGGFCEACPGAEWWPCEQYKLAHSLFHKSDRKLLKMSVKGRLDFVVTPKE